MRIWDYPGEVQDQIKAFEYVDRQHRALIADMEKLSGNQLSFERLAELVENSKKCVAAWNRIVSMFPQKDISPTMLFDDINF